MRRLSNEYRVMPGGSGQRSMEGCAQQESSDRSQQELGIARPWEPFWRRGRQASAGCGGSGKRRRMSPEGKIEALGARAKPQERKNGLEEAGQFLANRSGSEIGMLSEYWPVSGNYAFAEVGWGRLCGIASLHTMGLRCVILGWKSVSASPVYQGAEVRKALKSWLLWWEGELM